MLPVVNNEMNHGALRSKKTTTKSQPVAALLMLIVLLVGSVFILYTKIESSDDAPKGFPFLEKFNTILNQDEEKESHQLSLREKLWLYKEQFEEDGDAKSAAHIKEGISSLLHENKHKALYIDGLKKPSLLLEMDERWRPDDLLFRRKRVEEAVQSAWRAYETYAWPHDELCPMSKQGKDTFGGLGATIVDSLDTLYMVGLKSEFKRAVHWATTKLDLVTDQDFEASAFEIIIRIVGGLLSAYELSGDVALLNKATEVANRLMPIYSTPTGLPYNIINLHTQAVHNPAINLRSSTLAEYGTHQMEFVKLSQLTGNSTYAERAEASIQFLRNRWPTQGLKPLFINPISGNFIGRKISFGALGDSYYEYLLKVWLLKGKNDEMYREMWVQAMDDMLSRLVYTNRAGMTYIAEFDRYSVRHKMDHLTCFVPGMLTLGVQQGAIRADEKKAERYIDVAKAVTETCWRMYREVGVLSPEYVSVSIHGMRAGVPTYYQRPEVIESFFYLWRYTKDWKYRMWGWEIFQAIEKWCKTESGGYAGVKDVRKSGALVQEDTQQSFFIAETLKYLWLLFSEDQVLNLDEYVLTTEAHPLRIG